MKHFVEFGYLHDFHDGICQLLTALPCIGGRDEAHGVPWDGEVNINEGGGLGDSPEVDHR